MQPTRRQFVLGGAFASTIAKARSQGPVELVIRADDMGLARDVNRGIIKAHREGIVTSASLMPPTAYFEEAVALCKANPELAPGIHVTLLATTPVRPLLAPEEVPSLIGEDGFFYRSPVDLYQARPKLSEVEKEVRAQIARSLATGLAFVYIDWHIVPDKGWPPETGITELFLRLSEEYKMLCTQDVDGVHAGARYIGAGLEGWGAQRLPDGSLVYWARPHLPEQREEAFLNAIGNLKPGVWWQNVHPGYLPGQARESAVFLCSEPVKRAIEERGVRLISYRDLRNRKYGGGQAGNRDARPSPGRL